MGGFIEMIIAIDPGASGAFAFFSPEEGRLELLDVPTVKVKRGSALKTEISPQMASAIIAARNPAAAVIEKVGAAPGQGVSSMFQFGRSVGMIEGILAALQIPTSYVTPQKWMAALNCRPGKDGNRARAAELFPAYASEFVLKKSHGKADAALMAYWMAAFKN